MNTQEITRPATEYSFREIISFTLEELGIISAATPNLSIRDLPEVQALNGICGISDENWSEIERGHQALESGTPALFLYDIGDFFQRDEQWRKRQVLHILKFYQALTQFAQDNCDCPDEKRQQVVGEFVDLFIKTSHFVSLKDMAELISIANQDKLGIAGTGYFSSLPDFKDPNIAKSLKSYTSQIEGIQEGTSPIANPEDIVVVDDAAHSGSQLRSLISDLCRTVNHIRTLHIYLGAITDSALRFLKDNYQLIPIKIEDNPQIGFEYMFQTPKGAQIIIYARSHVPSLNNLIDASSHNQELRLLESILLVQLEISDESFPHIPPTFDNYLEAGGAFILVHNKIPDIFSISYTLYNNKRFHPRSLLLNHLQNSRQTRYSRYPSVPEPI